MVTALTNRLDNKEITEGIKRRIYVAVGPKRVRQ